jgi:hypothetical protein
MRRFGICQKFGDIGKAASKTRQVRCAERVLGQATRLPHQKRRLKGGGRQDCLPHSLKAFLRELRYSECERYFRQANTIRIDNRRRAA